MNLIVKKSEIKANVIVAHRFTYYAKSIFNNFECLDVRTLVGN